MVKTDGKVRLMSHGPRLCGPTPHVIQSLCLLSCMSVGDKRVAAGLPSLRVR